MRNYRHFGGQKGCGLCGAKGRVPGTAPLPWPSPVAAGWKRPRGGVSTAKPVVSVPGALTTYDILGTPREPARNFNFPPKRKSQKEINQSKGRGGGGWGEGVRPRGTPW